VTDSLVAMPATSHESTSRSLADLLDRGPPGMRDALAERLRTLLAALGAAPHGGSGRALTGALDGMLAGAGPEEVWLAIAVLTGQLPDSAGVLRTLRAMRLDGPLTALAEALADAGQLDATDWPPVEVISDRVVIDVHHTATTSLATGIQRVAREAVRRWRRDHELLLLGWTDGHTALRYLKAGELAAVLGGSSGDVSRTATSNGAGVVVPWRCSHVLPELIVDPPQAHRYQALARFARSRTGSISFDCVPLLTAETCADGMAGGFACYLAALGHLDRVATISESAASEYRGWRAMLCGTGLPGPEIRSIALPMESRTPSDTALREARELMIVGQLPMVLAVGNHEPRKNHLALLHAAEMLWRQGLQFSLTFVGGNAWNSERFTARVEALCDASRPVQAVLGLPDDLLWAAYRLAYCTVFPSLHEGFGLPVAESLASGTPVITSPFGSMREIAGSGGALLADPRDDKALADALRRLLVDRSLRDRLAAETSRLALRTWDEYASQTWSWLVEEPLHDVAVRSGAHTSKR
jgi:glycosyltransferase involved in cell wall biosynthesis